MKFDRRVKTGVRKADLKPVDLPIDYLRLVEDTLAESLKPGIVELKKIHPVTELKACGAIFGDEVLLAITISHGEKSVIATTVYASADFNPLMPEPGIETILTTCLDSVGTVLDHYLNPAFPDRIARLAEAPISALEEAPFDWTPIEDSKIPVWVKIDKSNPSLEALTEEWLMKNDPTYSPETEEDEAEEFLNERLSAIEKAKSGSGGKSGPIQH